MTLESPGPQAAMPYSEYWVEVPFLDHLSVMVEPAASGVLLVVDLQREHLNGRLQAHGGLIMTLLDMALANAARMADPQGRSAVTVELKSNFIRPGGTAGGRLEARGTCRHGTQSLAFCDGELRDRDGTLVATASGTFKYINPVAKNAPAPR